MTSCSGSRVDKLMERAERVMDERPDSAVRILSSIKREDISGKKRKALYALLYTKAQYKNYVDEEDDSLINVAVEYYEQSSDSERKFEAYFYQGIILENRGETEKTMRAFMNAEQLVSTQSDGFKVGRLYFELGILYMNNLDYQRGLDSFQKACEYFEQSNKLEYVLDSYYCIGTIYTNIGEKDKSIDMFCQILSKVDASDNEELYKGSVENLIILNVERKKYTDAIAFRDSLFQNSMDENLSSQTYAALSRAYMYENKTDTAFLFLKKARESLLNVSDSVSLYVRESEVNELAGNLYKSLNSLKIGTNIYYDWVNRIMSHPVISYQKEYYRQQAEMTRYELRIKRNIWFSVISFTILISIVSLLLLQRKLERKNNEINKYIDLAEELSDKNSSKEKTISNLSGDITLMKDQIAQLVTKQHDLLSKLCTTYYATSVCHKEKDALYEDIKKEIDLFSNNQETINRLEEIINRYEQNVMMIVRREFPALKEKDYKFLCFVYAGFSAKAICVFTGDNLANVFTKKSRFKKKIEMLACSEREILLHYLP